MTGPAGGAVAPDAQAAAAGRKGLKAELDGLRERMLGLGFSYDDIAAEVSRRYRLRPREAYRLAWGWSLEQAAARFNDRAARADADPEARASLTGSRLCEHEKRPHSMRKPSVYVLFMLAEVYQTDVLGLLDLADHENLPQQDRLVLLRRPRAATPFGERVVALMEARLDDLLEAGGELVTLAQAAEIVTGHDDLAASGNPRGQAPGTRAAMGEGMSLSLPYVPGRLVTGISGPAEDTAQLTAGGGDRTAAGGRLALVRRAGGPDDRGTEVTGA